MQQHGQSQLHVPFRDKLRWRDRKFFPSVLVVWFFIPTSVHVSQIIGQEAKMASPETEWDETGNVFRITLAYCNLLSLEPF